MTDDELEALLAEAARARRDREDAHWEAVARGELSDEERAALVGEEHLAALLEPLDEGFLDATTGRVLDKQKAERAGRNRRRLSFVLPVLLAAAALLLVLRGAQAPEPWPTYALEVQGGDRTLRGTEAPDAPIQLSPGTRLEIVARPDAPVARPVGATARVRLPDGEVAPFGGRVEVAGSGAIRLTGTLGTDLDLPPGTSRIGLAVHDPGDAPRELDPALQGARPLSDRVFLVDVEVVLVP